MDAVSKYQALWARRRERNRAAKAAAQHPRLGPPDVLCLDCNPGSITLPGHHFWGRATRASRPRTEALGPEATKGRATP
jgi:hypothetical protein